MTDSSAPAQRIRSRLRSHWRLATLIGALFVAVILISCATVTRTVVAPPEIPGAEFVGSKTCAECHEVADFEGEDAAALSATLKKITAGQQKHKTALKLTDAEIADLAAYIASGGK